MKKILLLIGLFLAFSYAPNALEAQTLTRAEIEANLPQLTNTVASLNTTTAYINARINTENFLFRQYSNILASLSLKINSSPPPTVEELQSINRTLTEVQTQIAVSESWRAQVRATTANIIEILGNIRTMISAVV